MKRILFLSIVAVFALLSLFLTLPRPVAPATASPVIPRPVATMPTVSAVGVPATAPATAVVQPTITPTEAPVVVVPVEPPAEPPAQQGTTKEDTQTRLIQLSLKAKVIWPQYDISIVAYGWYTVRDAKTGLPVNDIGPVDAMRLSELAATGR